MKVKARTRTVRPDSRFFWNEAAVEPLLELFNLEQHTTNLANSDPPPVSVLLEHVIPVTSAFCGVQTNLSITVPENKTTSTAGTSNIRYDQLLLTRRGRFRAGTRFTKRGADATGAVANYAETEQVVFVWEPHGEAADPTKLAKDSYDLNTHTRICGESCADAWQHSIPLRWSSPTDIKTYRPRKYASAPTRWRRRGQSVSTWWIRLFGTFVSRTTVAATTPFRDCTPAHRP